jgi:hypothetical protein
MAKKSRNRQEGREREEIVVGAVSRVEFQIKLDSHTLTGPPAHGGNQTE